MLATMRRLLVAALLLLSLVACNSGATADVAEQCASAAEEGNSPEDIRAHAEEEGMGEIADAMIADAEESKAYEWATCMMENDYGCHPLTAAGPPKTCSDGKTAVDNPFGSQAWSSGISGSLQSISRQPSQPVAQLGLLRDQTERGDVGLNPGIESAW